MSPTGGAHFAGGILADLGAHVVRLNDHDDDSATDRYRNHGKSRAEAGQGLSELLPLVDVFIENGGPRSGLDRARARRPNTPIL